MTGAPRRTVPSASVGSARALLRPTLRSVPWPHIAAGGALAAALMTLTLRATELGLAGLTDRLRASSVLLAVGVAGALDDPTRPHLDGAPVSVALRQSLRLAVALGAVGVCWIVVLLLAAAHPAATGGISSLPVAASTVVLAALVAATLAAAAAATRVRGGSGAIPAAATALALPALAVVVPQLAARWGDLDLAMFPSYAALAEDAQWVAAHQRWLVVAVAASAVLTWALPGPRGWRPRSRPNPRGWRSRSSPGPSDAQASRPSRPGDGVHREAAR